MEELMKELNSIKKNISRITHTAPSKRTDEVRQCGSSKNGDQQNKKRVEGQKHGHTCN